MRSFILSLLSSLLLSSAAAQTPTQTISRPKLIVANAAIGALTSGIAQAVQGRSFWKGFAKGSAGGAFVYAGKCLIAQRSSAGDWLGREIVAVGSSVVSNAAAGRGMFEQMNLPVGPVWIYRDNKSHEQRLRLDLSTVLIATYLSGRPRTSFNLSSSLFHGVFVFERSSASIDLDVAGVLRMRPGVEPVLYAHELTHVAQDEFVSIAWSDPLEGWILDRTALGQRVHRNVAIGILQPMWAVLDAEIPSWDRPWEKEAHSFELGC